MTGELLVAAFPASPLAKKLKALAMALETDHKAKAKTAPVAEKVAP